MSKQFAPQKPLTEVAKPVKLWQQVLLGLSLSLATGVFIGIGIAADVAAADVGWALTFAALLALGNGWAEAANLTVDASLPSQQNWLQFTAQCTLFLAKLTAGAAAALGLAGYLLSGLPQSQPIWLVPTALLVMLVLTRIPWGRNSSARAARIAAKIAAVSLLGLLGAGLSAITQTPSQNEVLLARSISTPLPALLQATALMSAAYTGFESLKLQPNSRSAQRVIGAISLAVVLAWLLYLTVATIGIRTVSATVLGSSVAASVAPLVTVMRSLALPGGVYLIILGAVAAMSGRLILLLPQLTEQLLALNQAISPVQAWLDDRSGTNQTEIALSPRQASVLVSIILSCILLVGDVQTIWSFSAFAFLMHYALIHWAALRRSDLARPYPRWLSGVGLLVCLFLAFWVEWSVWLVSLGLVALSLVWRGMMLWTDEQG
jgi:APA family basic amino acid/polyamine antiporter